MFVENILVEKNSSKILMKKNRSTIIFDQEKRLTKKKSTKRFQIFFDEKFFARKFLGHLFRSQISPRFQKSYLENRAMSLKMRKIEQTKFVLQISPDFGHIWLHVMYNYPRAPA